MLSCTKVGRNITIKGKVLNPVTNTPIEGVEVWFQRTTSGLPGGYKTIKEEITDVNGEFEINATRIGGTQYIRLGDVKGNYRLGWYEDGEYKGSSVKTVKKGKTMEVEYHLVPYGDYLIIVNNINCEGVNDTIIINQQNQVNSFLDSDWILSGCDGYTTTFSKVPMGSVFINWTVIRNGVSQSFSDIVFLDEGQQLTYELNY